MTKQELFNMAYLGLKSQGFEQSVRDEVCMYRAPDGKRCAIGWCIPDEAYRYSMEALTPLGSDEVQSALGVTRGMAKWLNGLQDCHDAPCEYGTSPDIKRTLEGFAEKHNLTVPA